MEILRRERKPARSKHNQHSTGVASLPVGATERSSFVSFPDPHGQGRPSSPENSPGFFLCGLFSRSRNNSTVSLNVTHNTPDPTTLAASEISHSVISYRTPSNPITLTSEVPTTNTTTLVANGISHGPTLRRAPSNPITLSSEVPTNTTILVASEIPHGAILHRTPSNPITVTSEVPISNTTTLVASEISHGATLYRTPSKPITFTSEVPTIKIRSSSPPPEELRTVVSLDGRPHVEAAEAPPVSEEVARERSRRDTLRTTYNGIKQALDIAAESADSFPPVKDVLGGLRSVLMVSETYRDNKDLEALLNRLETMKFSETVDAKAVGREKLLPKLKEICADLHRISEQNVETVVNISRDEETIAGWVSDLNDLLVKCQISTHHASLGMSSEIKSEVTHCLSGVLIIQRAQLNKLPRAKDAGFKSGNRQSCLEGTCKDILEKIITWERDLTDRRVFWLSGNAGSGKSTICQTFAEHCSDHGLLGASFFCSRNFQDRSNLNLIFPTLALDLAYRYPAFEGALITGIKKSPNPGHGSLTSQLETLLIEPLKASGISTVIVIDALDECKDEQATSSILFLLEQHIKDLPSVKFLITGRPESRIQSALNLPDLRSKTDAFLLHEVMRESVDSDIRLYIQTQLSKLALSRRGIQFPDQWPDSASLEFLVQRAGGLFIFASTICRLMSSVKHDPLNLLQKILDTRPSTDDEGQLGLDALYAQILTKNHETSPPLLDVSPQVKHILGTIVVAPNPVLPETLAILLDMEQDGLQRLLGSLESVIQIQPFESPEIPIAIFHKSFPDYLLDKNRCQDLRFHVDASEHHARLAVRSLELMQQRLKRNICDLPRYSMNSEVKDLAERRSKYIGEALEYACTSWVQHLSQASKSNGIEHKVVELMEGFMQHHLLPWLEVLSITGNLRTAVYSLRDAKVWVVELAANNMKLLKSIEDGERFILKFFDIIVISASHIYDSAAIHSPKNSIIQKCYKQDLPRFWSSLDDPWDPCIRKIGIEYSKCVVFSHKGDRVAACGGKDYSQDQESNFVVIIEAATGTVLSTFKGHERVVHSVAFSPDDSLLVSGSEDCTVRLWEIQTGALVRTLRLEERVLSVEFSHDGSMIACNAGIWDRMLQRAEHKFDERVGALAWSPNKAEVVLGYGNGSIKILNATNWRYSELASALHTTHENSVCSLAYAREGTRVASCSKHTTMVHGVDAGAVLHNFFTFDVRSVCFSRDGERLVIACGNSMEIRDLAKSVDIAGLRQPKRTHSVSVSPDGTSIALADDDKLSIWQMDAIRSNNYRSDKIGCVEISPNSAFIASGSWGGDVQLWDFATGECLHTFSRFTLNARRHSGVVSCIAISPDSSLVASFGSSDRKILVWSVADRAWVCSLGRHDRQVIGVAFSPNGQRIACVSDDGTVRLWEVKEKKTVGILKDTGFEGVHLGLKFSDDGTSITVSRDEESRSWKMIPCDESPSSDPVQLPISFISQEHVLDNHSLALYKHDRGSEWIIDRDGVRVCWLLQDFREGVSHCQGSKFVMGSESGRVCWFEFDLSHSNN